MKNDAMEELRRMIRAMSPEQLKKVKTKVEELEREKK